MKLFIVMSWIKVRLMCRRKALLAVVLVLIIVLVFIKQNHFSRSDVLKPARKSKLMLEFKFTIRRYKVTF